jgi:hypothetical protein
LNHFFSPFVLGIFKIGSCELLAQAGLEPWSSWSLPSEKLGLQVWVTGIQLEDFSHTLWTYFHFSSFGFFLFSDTVALDTGSSPLFVILLKAYSSSTGSLDEPNSPAARCSLHSVLDGGATPSEEWHHNVAAAFQGIHGRAS